MKRLFFLISLFIFSPVFAVPDDGIEVDVEYVSPQILPRNGVRVPFLIVHVTALSNVSVKSMKLQQIGLSDNDDIEEVWAEGVYSKSVQSRVQNSGAVEIRFLKPHSMKRGDREEFLIVANLDVKGVGRTISFQLKDVVTDHEYRPQTNVYRNPKTNSLVSRYRSLGGNYPGSQYRGSYDRSPLSSSVLNRASGYTIDAVDYQDFSSGGSITYGTDNRIGKFRLSNKSRQSVYLEEIKLKNVGTANLRDTFTRVRLEDGRGRRITSSGEIDRKYVTFDMEDYELEGRDSEVFHIWAVPSAFERGKTIRLVLDDESDLISTSRNSYVRTNRNSPDMDQESRDRSGDRNQVIHTGSNFQSTKTGTSSNLWNRDYSPNSRDVTLLSQRLYHKAPVRLDRIRALVGNGSTVSDKNGDGWKDHIDDYDATFDEFRLYINGEFVDEQNRFDTKDELLFVEFDADYDLDREAIIVVTGRVTNKAQTGDRLKLTLHKDFSFPEAEFIR